MRASTFRPLRLVVPDSDSRDRVWEQRWDGPLPAARPGDRCEPWPLSDPGAANRIAQAATSHGLSTSLAALVTIECVLTIESLDAIGAETPIEAIDQEAAVSRVRRPLSEPSRAYLQALSSRGVCSTTVPLRHVPLPMRLTDLVRHREIDSLLDASELDRAISWERAALLAGRTMGEWAACCALRAARR